MVLDGCRLWWNWPVGTLHVQNLQASRFEASGVAQVQISHGPRLPGVALQNLPIYTFTLTLHGIVGQGRCHTHGLLDKSLQRLIEPLRGNL